jgi:hypothetical protein
MVNHRSFCVAALVLLGLVCCDAVFTHQSHSIRDGEHAARRLLHSSGTALSSFQLSDQQQQQAQGPLAVAGVPGTATEGISPGTTAAVLKVKHKHVREYALAVTADPNAAVTVTASPTKPVLVVEIGPAAAVAAAAGSITPPGDLAAVAATDRTPQQQQQQQQEQPGGSGTSKASDGDGDEGTPKDSSSTSSTATSPSNSSTGSALPGALLPPPPAAQPANLESGTAPVLIKSSSSSGVGGNGAMFDVGAGGYAYLPPSSSSSSSSVPLGMPVTETGLQLSRWVMVAWGVSNFSNPVMLSSDVMREVQAM